MATPHQHQPSTIRNGLLAALPPEDLAALRPGLQPAELPFDQTLYLPGGWHGRGRAVRGERHGILARHP